MNIKITPTHFYADNHEWGPDITHIQKTVSPHGRLSIPGWFHFYPHETVAALLHEYQYSYTDPVFWKCQPSGIILHEPLKSGSTTLTTIKQVNLPTLTDVDKIEFVIALHSKYIKNDPHQRYLDKFYSGSYTHEEMYHYYHSISYETISKMIIGCIEQHCVNKPIGFRIGRAISLMQQQYGFSLMKEITDRWYNNDMEDDE